MGWAGSVIYSHSKKSGSGSPPKLSKPTIPISKASYRPLRYFSKGIIETDLHQNPQPIPQLLIESDEVARARPVPGTSFLLRSICKGKGTLRQNNLGLVFLDIDNRFTSTLLPYLKSRGLISPPYFNFLNYHEPKGVHIPVIPPREIAFQYLTEIEELGEEFAFEIEGLYSMEPTSWPGVEQVWFFKIQSPELEKFRRSHFLTATPGGHSFHVAVAIKVSPTTHKAPGEKPLLKINPGFLAA